MKASQGRRFLLPQVTFLCTKHSIYFIGLFNPLIKSRKLSNFPRSQSCQGQSHRGVQAPTKVKPSTGWLPSPRSERLPQAVYSALLPRPSSLSPSQTTPLGSRLPGWLCLPRPWGLCVQESTKLTHSIHANKDPCTHPCLIHTLTDVHLSTDAQALTSHVQAKACSELHLCTEVGQ